jgi:hypothetical protein
MKSISSAKVCALLRVPNGILHLAWVLGAMTALTVGGQGVMPDSLRWISAPASAQAGSPFVAALQARDLGGNIVTNFNGPVRLSVVVRSAATRLLITEVAARTSRAVELCNVSDTPLAIGGWRITAYDSSAWPAPRATFIIPQGTVCAPHGVFQLASGGNAPGFYPTFFLGTNLDWLSNVQDNPIAVLLRDSAGNLEDFFCACGGYPLLINSPTAIPRDFWQGLRRYHAMSGKDCPCR